MTGKRGAANYLTHDNWDREEKDDEGPGVFEQADNDVLKNRVIKKARRRVMNVEQKVIRLTYRNFDSIN